MCNPFTIIDPELAPDDELVCSLMIKLRPPGREMATFGLRFSTGSPATTRPTMSELPLVDADPPLQVALVFDFTTSAATRPPSRLTFATEAWD